MLTQQKTLSCVHCLLCTPSPAGALLVHSYTDLQLHLYSINCRHLVSTGGGCCGCLLTLQWFCNCQEVHKVDAPSPTCHERFMSHCCCRHTRAAGLFVPLP